MTRMLIGCSKRVKTGNSRPDSRLKASSRKSRAISAFERCGRAGVGAAKVLTGGRALTASAGWAARVA